MSRPKTTFLKMAALALTVTVPAAGYVLLAPVPALAAGTLPAPSVSRALDAVLMPVDASVVSAFGLAAGSTGVLVLATEPDGLADAAGIEPGDVIDFVKGEAILSPADLDEVVYYWILQGAFDFEMNALRGGKPYKATTTITLESWESVIDITTVSSWSSYSYESFSYSEYYAEYSEEITESYEASETMIEESVTSEEFETDMQAEDEGYAEVEGEAVDGDMAGDEAVAEDEVCDPAVNPDCADAAADEGAADAGDESAADEGAADDGAGDDSGDAGGDEGGEEEIVE
ncbi:PDZ domain-containing protein [Paragemmobacter aquarius]|nr:PDZ domain-containing protein [Gemmobacter aquarius]